MKNIRSWSIIVCFAGILLIQPDFSYTEDVTKKEAQELAQKISQKMGKVQGEEKWKAEEYYELGLSYYKDNMFLKAFREFEKANRIEPGNKKVKAYLNKAKDRVEEEAGRHFSYGLKFYKQKRFDESRLEFEKVPVESSKYQDAQGYIKKVDSDKESEQIKAQEKEAKEKREAEEKDRMELLTRGKEAYKRGDYKEAQEVFAALSSRYPQDEQIQEWLRLSQSNLERLEQKESVKKEKEKTKEESELTILRKEAHEKAMMLDVERKYLPPERGEAGAIVTPETREEDAKTRQIKFMRDKLSEIEVPEVNFNNVDIREVIRTLAKMTGVNIFIDEVELGRLAQGMPPTAAPAPSAVVPDRPFPGGLQGPVEEPVVLPPPTGAGSLNVTIKTYSKMPLLNLLEYTLNTTGLAYRIEPSYIFISTPGKIKVTEQVTISYKLKYGVTKRRLVAPMTPEALLGTTE